ncbi:MAG: hypothetical protein AMS27_17545 [Bacteroides sp. SM23_62_1]|nr:MAG: hypothetical protein AMS27_17545 [Bacteroides sp. SM23_62_1]
MEDMKKIEELIRKYYDGETSLEEERKLHWFFQTSDIPSHLQSDADIFRYHYKQRKEEPSAGLEEKLIRLLQDQEHKKSYSLSGRSIRLVSGIAASILVLLALWMGIGRDWSGKQQAGTFQDTYDDPQLAYLETKKVLIMVSEKLNTGTKDLEYLRKYDEGIDMLGPVLSFSPSVQRLDKLSKFNEAKELITKKH